jgi:predicted RecA/RadA family phage recombinase
MSQAIFQQAGEAVDYTPAGAVTAGDVVVIGSTPLVAFRDIAAGILGALATEGVFKVLKTTDVFAAGDPVYWTPTADPVSGTAGTGAAGKTGTYFMGFVPPDGAALTGDATVQVILRAGTTAGTLSVGASTAAAGTTTADAGVLPAATSRLYPTTAADGTKGVRINAADKVTGREIRIGNGVAAQILKVYPPSGGTINGAAADAAFSSASGKGVIVVCLSSTANTWLAW